MSNPRLQSNAAERARHVHGQSYMILPLNSGRPVFPDLCQVYGNCHERSDIRNFTMQITFNAKARRRIPVALRFKQPSLVLLHQ